MLQLKGYGLNNPVSKKLHLYLVKWFCKTYFEGNVIPPWIMFTGEEFSRPETALFTYHTEAREVDGVDGEHTTCKSLTPETGVCILCSM